MMPRRYATFAYYAFIDDAIAAHTTVTAQAHGGRFDADFD